MEDKKRCDSNCVLCEASQCIGEDGHEGECWCYTEHGEYCCWTKDGSCNELGACASVMPPSNPRWVMPFVREIFKAD